MGFSLQRLNAALRKWERQGLQRLQRQQEHHGRKQQQGRTPVTAGSPAKLQDENNNCGACNSRDATPVTVSATAAIPGEVGTSEKEKRCQQLTLAESHVGSLEW